MKLTDLDPKFLKIAAEQGNYILTDDITQADGILFLCPECFKKNKGAEGTHSVKCWKKGIDASLFPKPGRWKFSGTGYDNLSLKPSIQINGSCNAHFHITAGQIR